MTLHASIVRLIDALRIAVVILYVPLLFLSCFIGFVALSDFSDRGCFVGEAMQCSDAQSVILMALTVAVAGPLLWGALTILRKLGAVRKGGIDA